MPDNAAAAARRAGPTSPEKKITLEKLNARSNEPGANEVKSRIRAWQEGGQPEPAIVPPLRLNKAKEEKGREKEKEKAGARIADKGDLPKEKIIRVESPAKSPTKKTFDIVQDEATGKVQGIKIITPAKPQKSPIAKPGPAELDPHKKAWVRKKPAKLQEDLDDGVKHAGQPKKRVVSDGHWRKDRSPAKKEPVENSPIIEEPKPRKIVAQKSTPEFRPPPATTQPSKTLQSRPHHIRQPVREKQTWHSWDPSTDAGPKTRSPRRLSRSRSRERPDATSSVNVERHVPKSTQDKSPQTPYTIRRTSAKPETDRRSLGSDDTVRKDEQEPQSSGKRRRHRRRRRSSPSTSGSDADDSSTLASPLPDDSISRRNAPTQPTPRKLSRPAPRKPSPPRETPMRTSPKPDLRNPGVEKTSEPKFQPFRPNVYANRIDAWLGGTPDPFVEDSNSPQQGSSENSAKDNTKGTSDATKRRASLVERGSNAVGKTERDQFGKRSPRDKENRGDEVDSPPSFGKQNTGRRGLRQASAELFLGSEPPRRAEVEKLETLPSKSPISANSPTLDSNRVSKGAVPRKNFPSTGRPLSTIASMASLDTRAQNVAPAVPSVIAESVVGSMISTSTAAPGPQRQKSGLKRRLTRHDDLISVLSLPRGDASSLAPARSIRTQRTRIDNTTIDNILAELASDESKYQREIRTLVDGVIPVLLSNVLSKSNSAVTAGLFGPSHKNAATVTQPIVDMGVALERLKTNHKRMPQTDPEALIKWAQTAAKVYSDYVKAWRMGFDDVIVNLAPPDPSEKKDGRWDDGMPRNEKGDLIDGDGERVDVAFLLKRPLIRLKYLAKTFRGINHLKPSANAESVADQYQELIIAARKKSNEERARLEDEAAASIDATRARDPRTLAPLAGVRIDPARCVRARDYFDMTLKHSSGQRLDCRIEIIIRDNEAEDVSGGDILICEVSETGRWLLFPPILQDKVSARVGGLDQEMIMMVRGLHSDGTEWAELLTLQSSDGQACEEWVQMMGEGPVPPSPTKTEFTVSMESPPLTESTAQTLPSPPVIESTNFSPGLRSPGSERPTVTFKSRTPSPTEIEIPIGEQARKTSKRWSQGIGAVALDLLGQTTPGLLRKPRPGENGPALRRSMSPPAASPVQRPSTAGAYNHAHAFTDKLAAQEAKTGGQSLRRSRATKHRRGVRSVTGSPVSSRDDYSDRERSPERVQSDYRPHLQRSPHTAASTVTTDTTTTSSSKKEFSVWLPSSSSILSGDSDSEDDYNDEPTTPVQSRPPMHRRMSSVPNKDMPVVNKLRKHSPPQTPREKEHRRAESEPIGLGIIEGTSSAPAKLQKRQTSAEKKEEHVRRPAETPTKSKLSIIPSLTPKFLQRTRRPSSPLKHEYAPSPMDSEYSSESDASLVDDNASESDTSDSEISNEDYDHFSTTKSPGLTDLNQFEKLPPPASVASLPAQTVAPSNSASQAPYRHVPSQQLHQASKTVANIFSWSNTIQGGWEPLHPQEITVIVSPGLIEAFSTAEAHSVPSTGDTGLEVSPSTHGIAPLIALELTPLVPLRRGTALDISIRSPPTPASLIKSSNNVMFRSRSPEECEILYAHINQARINNPTYIALQNARGPFAGSTWSAAMEQRAALRGASASGSWWNLASKRGSTYRSKSTRSRSRARSASLAGTDSSVGTMHSAFSALRRFSGSTDRRAFDIGKSTLGRRSQSVSLGDSASSGYSTPNPNNRVAGLASPPSSSGGLSSGVGMGSMGGGGGGGVHVPGTAGDKETELGISNTKIRLYERESASKWRDMGSARLTISLPPRPASSNPNMPASPAATLGRGKRVVVHGSTHGEILLDVVLGENCFERVARTGIAVSVWNEDQEGRAKAVGGVGSRVLRVFMVQMKSERDAAYTFGLVGKLRY